MSITRSKKCGWMRTVQSNNAVAESTWPRVWSVRVSEGPDLARKRQSRHDVGQMMGKKTSKNGKQFYPTPLVERGKRGRGDAYIYI